jgi:hypothetical protein
MVTIKKIHLAWAFILAVATPTAAAVSVYYKTVGDLAPKTQVEKMEDKLNRIAEDVAEIKGLLKARKP